MKRFLALLLIVAIFLLSCAPVATESQVKVVRVIDGDTIEIAGGAHVRYIGMDTPEIYSEVEFYGPKAKAKNIELVEGKLVTLEKDVSETDKYGRLLRYVYVDGVFVNGELVRRGYAEALS
jgi:micrococcal nuclease